MNAIQLPLSVHTMQLPLNVLLKHAQPFNLNIHAPQILIVYILELVKNIHHHLLVQLMDVQILPLPQMLLSAIQHQSIVHNSSLVLRMDKLVHVVQHNHVANSIIKLHALLIIHKLQLHIVFGMMDLVKLLIIANKLLMLLFVVYKLIDVNGVFFSILALHNHATHIPVKLIALMFIPLIHLEMLLFVTGIPPIMIAEVLPYHTQKPLIQQIPLHAL